MARIVLGIGASHTPLLTLSNEQWQHRAEADLANPQLNLSDGRFLNYGQLLAEVGPRYADVVGNDILAAKADICARSLDRLGDALAQAAPDLVLIVGDDQRELFSAANQPALALYHGEQVVTYGKYSNEAAPQWIRDMGRGYWMDKSRSAPGAPAFALSLLRALMDRDFDLAAVAQIDDASTSGFGHAYGFIIKRLFRGRETPVVPLLVNTYYPPNVPTARRCHDLGRAIREAVQAMPQDLRVAVIASGGLSHFVVDEALDRSLMAAFESGDHETLRALPREALNSGSSEILNWVVTAGAVEHLPLAWQEYQPLYRTPAGTGVGAAFAIWSSTHAQ